MVDKNLKKNNQEFKSNSIKLKNKIKLKLKLDQYLFEIISIAHFLKKSMNSPHQLKFTVGNELYGK